MLRMLLLLSTFAAPVAAQRPPVEIDNVPFSVSRCLGASKDKYAPSREMNPFYLRGDFNGDGRQDYVVLVREAASKKRGVAFCLGVSKLVVVGAGNSIAVEQGARIDDFESADIWGIATACGSKKHDCLYVRKAEAGGGYLVWNGARFTWLQAGI